MRRLSRAKVTEGRLHNFRVADYTACTLFTGASLIGPFELDCVFAKRAGFPCTDVSNLAIVVVVPTLPGNWVGDRFAKFMRRCRRERIEGSQAACASSTARIWHHRVVDTLTK